MLDAVGALAALPGVPSLKPGLDPMSPTDTGGTAPGSGPTGTSFAATLRSAVERLDGAVSSADRLAKSSAAGNHDIPLSDVMVSLEQANLALQLAANVRDKVVAAYTSIMNMPV